MPSVLDTTVDCSTRTTCLLERGYKTVVRYYSQSAWKRIGPAEGLALSVAGLKIAAVYQDRQNEDADFSEAKGRMAGRNASEYAQQVMFQPPGSGLYFSADYDASEAAVTGRIIPFFRGIRQAFEETEADCRIGVYGSGRTCRLLIEEGLVELSWLSQSRGFGEYQKFLKSAAWHLKQEMPTTVCGMDCDPNLTNSQKPDFGAFQIDASTFGRHAPPLVSGILRHRVIASSGLRLRGGPGTEFPLQSVLPFGTAVTVLERHGDWAMIDISGDSGADGFVFAAFLKAV